jgi:hypothetical protein
MIPSLQINNRYLAYSCWLAARRSQARIRLLNSQAAALTNTPRNVQRAHLHRPAHLPGNAKISLHPPRPDFVSTAAVLKSP